ncbi:MAG TPA: DUF4147 domain-containing protein [Thermoleophilia bacterium]|nr:DUF4147 domain-containing protein [Thermoleophilia bacterium]
MPIAIDPRLSDHGRRILRSDGLAIAAAALGAADPAVALESTLRLNGDRLVVRGRRIDGLDEAGGEGETVVELTGRRLFLLGAGKATLGMAAVFDRLLGPRLVDAAVVVKRGEASGRDLRFVEVLEAAHPLPDEASLAAGLRLQALAHRAAPDDLVVALVTGGSSALAVAPAPGISLADTIATNRLLLSCGADIVGINAVRKHLSAIKGGLLGLACGCEILNFTASDVVGDPLDYVTDLTVPDSSTWASARATCDRFALWDDLPAAVAARLRRADPRQETPKRLPGVHTWVMADAARMCAAAAAEAAARGYTPEQLGLDWQGEARGGAAALVARLGQAAPGACLIAGGEHTVELRTGGAHGAGGPNQEAALAAALALAGGGEAAVVCLDSDGSDGPTDAAGGVVDDLTAPAAAAAGLDLPAALAGHAAYDTLAALGDLVVTGPTGTNVNDLNVALRAGARSSRPVR